MIPPELCRLYYSCMKGTPEYIDIPISRWDEDNWGVVIETFCNASNRNIIFNHLVPGAVTEMYNILDTPTFFDLTYNSGNTLIFHPLDGTGISGLRDEATVIVDNISDTFINKDYFGIKIEGKKKT
jgi:hypothetical protein